MEGVRCMDLECVKDRGKRKSSGGEEEDEGDVAEEDVRVILSEEEVKRWKWLKTKRDIERGPGLPSTVLFFFRLLS